MSLYSAAGSNSQSSHREYKNGLDEQVCVHQKSYMKCFSKQLWDCYAQEGLHCCAYILRFSLHRHMVPQQSAKFRTDIFVNFVAV